MDPDGNISTEIALFLAVGWSSRRTLDSLDDSGAMVDCKRDRRRLGKKLLRKVNISKYGSLAPDILSSLHGCTNVMVSIER